MPFAQRLTCTIDDACEVTGLGRTKLYELIGAGSIVTTTIGRRRLVVVRSLLALLDPICRTNGRATQESNPTLNALFLGTHFDATTVLP
jgi:excisionase family DNA binding protein